MHPPPVHQREVISVHDMPVVKEILCHLLSPKIRNVHLRQYRDCCPPDLQTHTLGGELTSNECLCHKHLHESCRGKFVHSDNYFLGQ
jgi:hypothetical protein